MTDDLLEAGSQSGVPQRAKPTTRSWVEWGLRLVTATALGIDSYVHAHDAGFYDFPSGGVISQGNLFRIEAGLAGLAGLVLLVWRHRFAWLMAFAVASSALGAVVLYTYVDVGALGPLPNMYEPTWAVPGKVLAAWAEGAAVVTSAAGAALSYLWPARTRDSRD